MRFKIAGKEVKLKFGLRFCRELDEVYRVDYEGLDFGMGVNLAFMNMQQKNPVGLAEVIKASSAHKGFSREQVDHAIEDYAEKEGDLSSLFEQVLDEMGKSNVVKHTINQLKETNQQVQKEQMEKGSA